MRETKNEVNKAKGEIKTEATTNTDKNKQYASQNLEDSIFESDGGVIT